jgi:hypothetical protein
MMKVANVVVGSSTRKVAVDRDVSVSLPIDNEKNYKIELSIVTPGGRKIPIAHKFSGTGMYVAELDVTKMEIDVIARSKTQFAVQDISIGLNHPAHYSRVFADVYHSWVILDEYSTVAWKSDRFKAGTVSCFFGDTELTISDMPITQSLPSVYIYNGVTVFCKVEVQYRDWDVILSEDAVFPIR